jgi:hypothetical protein
MDSARIFLHSNIKCKLIILSLITLIFLFINTMGLVDWSWWVVFSPIWIPLASMVVFIILFGINVFTWALIFGFGD